MNPTNTIDPRRRLRPEQRRKELVRVGVELLAEGTLDRTRVDRIIKRAGVLRTFFYHYFPSKMVFARAIVEYKVLHLHDLVEQQTALTLEGTISAFADYVKTRPDSLQMLRTEGLDQDPEIAAALTTSFECYEHLVLMPMDIPEPDAHVMFAAHVWISTTISLCLAWPDYPEISQEIITNMLAQMLRSLVSQARQGTEHTLEPVTTPAIVPEPVSNR